VNLIIHIVFYLKLKGYYILNFFIYGGSGYTLIDPNSNYIITPTGTAINTSILSSLSLIISGNNVGIGTATPLQKLDVYGNATIGNGQRGSASATVGGPFFKQISWDAAGVTHTLTYPVFCIGDNSAGTLHIQVSNKLTTRNT